ncbi:hypothetical protein [Paraburkholderia polaris]|uniref:hypothetical protein n=1 Tax=Paraburkholderia polaris TaxID=2728848 RepID=UPI001469A563|nr:hypothetical protein [Paraburkholderia polaris]
MTLFISSTVAKASCPLYLGLNVSLLEFKSDSTRVLTNMSLQREEEAVLENEDDFDSRRQHVVVPDHAVEDTGPGFRSGRGPRVTERRRDTRKICFVLR